ncbi:RluA family pseudouridine synthase [Cetobacterium sp. SF1]|uniref:RluA family pseudouridine synthase n=1 Tax=Cetobacterium sp. SF1 TaxID=3417654 RepID=UPI003CF5457F
MKKNQVLKVTKDEILIEFLLKNLNGKSRNNIKSLLAYGQILVNKKIKKQYNFELKIGDEVEIHYEKSRETSKNIGLEIVYEDKDIIVINKPEGLLSMATEKEKAKTAYSILMNYVKNQNIKNRIYIVHRLDRETSGVMIYAKTEKSKTILQENWNDMVKERIYVALVEGKIQKEKDTIKSWLKDNKAFVTYSTFSEQSGGKLAITNYETLKIGKNYSLLKVSLETGRKNQIRVHMSDIGHPIANDKKYGAKYNCYNMKRLGLHAQSITFIHPISKETMTFEIEIPDAFNKGLN